MTNRSLVGAFALLATLMGSGSAWSVFDRSKLIDWKYHALICKNVMLDLVVLSELELRNGKESVTAAEVELKATIQGQALNETAYRFDSQDAQLIADMVFATRKGLIAGGFIITRGVAENQGFDICVNSLDQFDHQFAK